ncbi:DNA polymerase zeta [Coemansia aciculifera]|nr:DNA polymerase zeta [Coemansia aciculifera]
MGLRVLPSSCSAHNLPVFDPVYTPDKSCSRPNDNCSPRVCSIRRQGMWGKGAISNLNHLAGKGTSLSRMPWHNGWWQFSLPPPRVHLSLSKDHTADAKQMAATPVQRRRRDQSDLKWSFVLGPLTAFPDAGSVHSPNKALACRSAKVPMSQMSLEILTCCREATLADPGLDEILCISACFVGCAKHRVAVWTCGSSTESEVRVGLSSQVEKRHLADEFGMIMSLVDWTRENDPDILCGYDIQQSSWGYVVERAERMYNLRLCSQLSRIIEDQPRGYQLPRFGQGKGSWAHRKGAAITVVGRHVLNIWRLMRAELSLTSYTFEKVAKEILGEQFPHYPPRQLAVWYSNGPAISRIRALQHVLYRSKVALRILDKTGIVARAAEFASVIGIDFNSVLTRGSQLRVESLMARIAHPELYILASPTRAQVAQQRAAECLPLVLEPQSRYYTDPVLVLDFQSLYPSVMIAYNYCYSTCLGSLEQTDADSDNDAGVKRRLGFTHVHAPAGMLSALKDNVTVSPNGVLFVKPAVRKGLLGRMLSELLESRVMLKDAMKQWGSSDEALFKKLDSWQLGLKLIANVTYGYAGASFSGRMPCVEVADAIVQSGRETLESAIRFIHSQHATWGARVVYGDTDSVFVHLPGKSRQTAFCIGQEIADAVTKMNPAPIKLKFEKVYQPCVLLTKKRYAGWMYTTAEQHEPLLDVKGMELVRRDGCMATQRILEGTLDSLFRTNDLSLVKSFVTNEITRILRGDVPLQEYIIAKEARMGTYSGRTLPAHAKVAADAMDDDSRTEPQYGERVPYVVVSSGRSARLGDQVVRPHQLLMRPELRINSQYYVDKQVVPALNRVLSLVGVDVRTWVSEMPRRLCGSIYDANLDAHSDSEGETGLDPTATLPALSSRRAAIRTLDQFYHKRDCFLCGQAVARMPPSLEPTRSADPSAARTCNDCRADTPAMLASVGAIQRAAGQALKDVYDQCVACVGGLRADALLAAQTCDSLDCPTMFQKSVLNRRYTAWHRAIYEVDNSSP